MIRVALKRMTDHYFDRFMLGALIGATLAVIIVSYYITFISPPSPVNYTYDPATKLCFAELRGESVSTVVPCTDAVIKAAGK